MSKETLDVAAESSPASTPDVVPEGHSTAERIAKLSGEDYSKYQLTGELPEIEKPAATVKSEAPKPAPASEPEKIQEPDKDEPRTWRQQRKIGELSAENRRLLREIEALKANPKAEIPTPSPKTVTSPSLDAPPRIEDFDSTEAFNKATSAYLRKVAKEEAETLDRQRRETEAQREAEIEAAEDNERYQSREREHKKASPTYDAAFKAVVAGLNQAFEQAPDRYVDRFLIKSDFGPAMVDHLYANPDQFKRLIALPRDEALVLLGKIEDRVEAAIKKAPKPNTVSKATDPPVKLGAKDEVTELKPGSPEWMAAENERDVKRMRG